MQDASPEAGPPPVFVGGTGRSGTTIVGQLIGASADYALVPIELRFHVDKGGLGDLARGEVTVDKFEATLLEKWYVRPPNNSGPRGVQVILDRPNLDTALHRLRSDHPDDPWGAAGRFLDDSIQPLQRSQNAQSWVEMTPPNAKVAPSLATMLPSARFVHMVRDGRDVASSVVRRPWGPDDLLSALTWWGNQMALVNASIDQVDPSKVLTMRLESFVGPSRSAAYAQLVEFLGREDDALMRDFFEAKLTQRSAHEGRWRAGLTEEEQQHAEDIYAEQLEALRASGHPLPAVL